MTEKNVMATHMHVVLYSVYYRPSKANLRDCEREATPL